MTFASACAPFSNGAVALKLPPLDPRDESPCVDPGVDGNAIKIVTTTRQALAVCSRKHENVVAQYNDARTQE